MCDCSGGGFGERIGAKVGRSVQGRIMNLPFAKKVKNWFGNGDYTVSMNSIINSTGGDPSNLKMLTHGNVYQEITYREYLGDVYSGAGPAGATGNQLSVFKIDTFALNPGLVQLHPWLAPIAQQYEQWEPMGYVFEFQSKLTDFSTTQNLGSVICASDYDVLDPVYSSKGEMLNAQYSSESKPTENILHGIECDPGQRPSKIFYIRSGAITGDLREYDLCNFNIASVSIPLTAAAGVTPTAVNLGSLYVHYTVRLYKPQLSNGLSQKGTLCALYGCTTVVSGAVLSSEFLYGTPWGVSGSLPVKTFDSIGLTFGLAASGAARRTITFPANITSGNFLIVYELGFAAGGAPTAGILVQPYPTFNCEETKQASNSNNGFFLTNSSNNDANLTAGSVLQERYVQACVVKITGPNAVVNVGPNTTFAHPATTLSSFLVYVTNVNNFAVV